MIDDSYLGAREIASADDMRMLGEALGRTLRAGDVVLLNGELGAGKTTLTRGIASTLGVRGPIQSPTFVIARTHPSLIGGPQLVHADAYRLQSALELDDLDIDPSAAVVVVEWGEGKAAGLADTWWQIDIERPRGGRGADTMCGTLSRAAEALDDDAPRMVTISRRSAA